MAADQLQERDQRIAELEAMVEHQNAIIERLEAQNSGDDLQELQAIIEAQEAALNDQRSVIASQSALIDELNGHLQEQLAAARAGVGSAGSGASPGGASAADGHGGTPITPAASEVQRRRSGASSNSSGAATARVGGGVSVRTLRDHQPSLHKAAQQSPRELPRPRPNSAFGTQGPAAAPGGYHSAAGTAGGACGSCREHPGGYNRAPAPCGTAQRARSCTDARLLPGPNGAPPPAPVPAPAAPPVPSASSGGRGPSPRGVPRGQQAAPVPRRVGGAVPHSLPLLRQEA